MSEKDPGNEELARRIGEVAEFAGDLGRNTTAANLLAVAVAESSGTAFLLFGVILPFMTAMTEVIKDTRGE
jgi:hypothetical protein